MRLLAAAAVAACLLIARPASAGAFYMYGTAQVQPVGPADNPCVVNLVSEPDPFTYGGLYHYPDSLPFDQFTSLNADFQKLDGTFVGGAPRFTLFHHNGTNWQAAYLYWTDPGDNDWHNTGDWIDPGKTNGWDLTQFGGGWDMGYNDALALIGNKPIHWVYLDLDAGWSARQELNVDRFEVNGQLFDAQCAGPVVPEPGTFGLLAFGLALLRRRR